MEHPLENNSIKEFIQFILNKYSFISNYTNKLSIKDAPWYVIISWEFEGFFIDIEVDFRDYFSNTYVIYKVGAKVNNVSFVARTYEYFSNKYSDIHSINTIYEKHNYKPILIPSKKKNKCPWGKLDPSTKMHKEIELQSDLTEVALRYLQNDLSQLDALNIPLKDPRTTFKEWFRST